MPTPRTARPKARVSRLKTWPVLIGTYVTPECAECLRELSKKTRIKQQDYLREAIDDLFKKYKKELRR